MEIELDVSGIINNLEGVEQAMDNGEVMRLLASEIMRYADDYAPFDTGSLKNTAFVGAMGDEIIYPMPYANYLYHGNLMVDPKTKKGSFYDPKTNRHWSRPNTQKELTNTPLHFKGEPKRGANWVHRAFEDHTEELNEALNKFIKERL